MDRETILGQDFLMRERKDGCDGCMFHRPVGWDDYCRAAPCMSENGRRGERIVVKRADPGPVATTPSAGPVGPVYGHAGAFPGPSGEADPTGRAAHAPGAKLDAGKREYDMVLFSFPLALAAVDTVGKFGARKYTKGGFLEVPNGVMRYTNALVRHLADELGGQVQDADSELDHAAHAAWNALARLELALRAAK